MHSPTGRRAAFNPALAAPYTGVSLPAARIALAGADYGQLEQHILDRLATFDSPAGPFAGSFALDEASDGWVIVTASGNARQRRQQVRAWKRAGHTVTQTNARTGDTITR